VLTSIPLATKETDFQITVHISYLRNSFLFIAGQHHISSEERQSFLPATMRNLAQIGQYQIMEICHLT
jgi:hypothetical protein